MGVEYAGILASFFYIANLLAVGIVKTSLKYNFSAKLAWK